MGLRRWLQGLSQAGRGGRVRAPDESPQASGLRIVRLRALRRRPAPDIRDEEAVPRLLIFSPVRSLKKRARPRIIVRKETRKRGSGVAQFTKMAIMDAFVQLLEETPLDKITVQEIIQQCQVSRNTFYYHFGDIYALLEAVLSREMDRLQQERPKGGTWVDDLRRFLDYLSKNRRMVYHIYHSVSHQLLEQYLFQVMEGLFMEYIREAAEGLCVDEADLEFLCLAYRSMFVGALLEWLRQGMHSDLEEMLDRAQRLFTGITRQMLERSVPSEGAGE